MVVFTALADESTAQTWKGVGNEWPVSYEKTKDCYSTTFHKTDTGVLFNTTRPLDCNIKDTYVVQLDKFLPLISSWKTDVTYLE